MKELLSIEYSKLKKLNSLKIIVLIYMALIPLWLYFLGSFFNMAQLPFFPKSAELWSFPLVWKFNTYCASFFNVLLGVVIVIVTCNEFSNKTFRQNIIDGMSKRQVIFSKFLVIMLLSVFVTLYTSLISVIYGLINTETVDLYKNSHFIFIYFLQTLCYFSFAFLLSILIKKPALSILIFILSFLVETIVGAFLPKIIYLFFPLNIFSKLTPIPFFENIIKGVEKQSGEVIPNLDLYQTITFACFYMLLFILTSYMLLKKRDI